MKKILICGDTNGSISVLCKQIKIINEKQGPFDFLLCCGCFTSVERYALPQEISVNSSVDALSEDKKQNNEAETASKGFSTNEASDNSEHSNTFALNPNGNFQSYSCFSSTIASALSEELPQAFHSFPNSETTALKESLSFCCPFSSSPNSSSFSPSSSPNSSFPSYCSSPSSSPNSSFLSSCPYFSPSSSSPNSSFPSSCPSFSPSSSPNSSFPSSCSSSSFSASSSSSSSYPPSSSSPNSFFPSSCSSSSSSASSSFSPSSSSCSSPSSFSSCSSPSSFPSSCSSPSSFPSSCSSPSSLQQSYESLYSLPLSAAVPLNTDCGEEKESAPPTAGHVSDQTEITEFEKFREAMQKEEFVVPTFFIDCGYQESILGAIAPEGIEICKNLFYLGGCGVKNIEGINVAFLSGKFYVNVHAANDKLFETEKTFEENQNVAALAEKNEKNVNYSNLLLQRRRVQNLLDVCIRERKKVDVLLTCQWPYEIQNELNAIQLERLNEIINVQDLSLHVVEEVSLLNLILEPRYHLAGSAKVFYQRAPFLAYTSGHLCKFIGLGEIGRKEKEKKAIHALMLMPMTQMQNDLLYSKHLCANNSNYSENKEFTENPFSRIYDNKHKFVDMYPVATYNKNDAYCNENIHNVDSHIGYDFETNFNCLFKRNASEVRMTKDAVDSAPQNNQTNYVEETAPLKRPKYRDEKSLNLGEAVYVKNLPFDLIDENSLKKVFENFGKIRFIRLPKNSQGKSIGKAWIMYYQADSAKNAANHSEEIEAGKRKLNVSLWYGRIPLMFHDNTNKGDRKERAADEVDVEPHDDCWFCLANPNAEKHLVIHVGSKVYASMAKGGMNEYHVLIIPVTHYPNFIYLNEEVAAEIATYIKSLRSCFNQHDLETIVYERFVPMKHARAMHMQIQVIPVEKHFACQISEVFIERVKALGLNFSRIPQQEDILYIRNFKDKFNFLRTSYFYFEAPGDMSAKGKMVDRYMCCCENGVRVPINFGREILAKIMNDPSKIEWKNCISNQDRETVLARNMRRMFQPFAPNY